MGGRGSSSSSRNTINATNMTDRQLRDNIIRTRNEMAELAKQTEDLAYQIEEAQASDRNVRNTSVSSARNKYNEVSDRYNSIRDSLAILESEQERRMRSGQQNQSSSRVFVNSYGEATRRNITSSSYENAQRRLQREMNRRFNW